MLRHLVLLFVGLGPLCAQSVRAEDERCGVLAAKIRLPQFPQPVLQSFGDLFGRLLSSQQSALTSRSDLPALAERPRMAHPLSAAQLKVLSLHAAALGDLATLKTLQTEAKVELGFEHLHRAAHNGQEDIVRYLLDDLKLLERSEEDPPLELNALQAAVTAEHIALSKFFTERISSLPRGSREAEILRRWITQPDELKISAIDEMARTADYEGVALALTNGYAQQPTRRARTGSWAFKIFTSPKLPAEQMVRAMVALHDAGYDFRGDEALMLEFIASGNPAAVIQAFEYDLRPRRIPKDEFTAEFLGSIEAALARLGLEFDDYPGTSKVRAAAATAPTWLEDEELLEWFPDPAQAVAYLTTSPGFAAPEFLVFKQNPLRLASRGNFAELMAFLHSPKSEVTGHFELPALTPGLPAQQLPLAPAVIKIHNFTAEQLFEVVKKLQERKADWDETAAGLSSIDYAYQIGFPKLILLLNDYSALPSGNKVWTAKDGRAVQKELAFQRNFAQALNTLGLDEMLYPGLTDVVREFGEAKRKAELEGDKARLEELYRAKWFLLSDKYFLAPVDNRFRENNFGSIEW